MKVLPSDSPFLKTQLSKLIPLGTNVVVMHLGRGGVENGVLNPYNRGRVLQTLSVVASIESIRPRATVRALWTGGHNRQQDRTGNTPPISEAKAAHDYAATLIDDEMLVEDQSTSTVENATRSREMVAADDTLVVVTDKLHYLARKVQFIFWLTYPRHRVVFIMLPKNPPGTDWLSRCKHLVSTITTIVGMLVPPVKRGDSTGIQRRQNRLQSITGH